MVDAIAREARRHSRTGRGPTEPTSGRASEVATAPLPSREPKAPSLEETAARWRSYVSDDELTRATGVRPDPREAADAGELVVMHWSLENLFDAVDDPLTHDEEFTPAHGYDEAAVALHVQNTARIVLQMNAGRGPDIFTVTEVENRGMVDRLAAALAPAGLKGIAHYESRDGRGIEQALYTRLPLLHSAYWELATISGGRTRGVLQADLDRGDGKVLTVLVVHAPSPRGGDRAVADRRAVLLQVRGLLDTLKQRDPERQVMIVGDYNESPDGPATGVRGLDATLSPAEARASGKPFNAMGLLLAAKGRAGDVAPGGRVQGGTHFYRGKDNPGSWSLFDNMVVTSDFLDGNGLRLSSGWPQVVALPELLKDGVPRRFFGKQGRVLGDFSDHLPVMLRVHRAQGGER